MAFGSDGVVIVTPVGAIRIDSGFVALWPPLSATLTVKLAVPGAVGVPEITPAALKVKPAGSAPVEVHVLPPVPPLATRVCEYATPTWPSGSDGVVTVRIAGSTVIVSGLDAV